jgi:hypothetical protein
MLTFLVCAVVLSATPAQGGSGTDPNARSPVLKAPAEEPGRAREPLPRPRADPRDNASTGASTPERRGGTDLGYEAEKEEEAFLKKKRTAPLKAR